MEESNKKDQDAANRVLLAASTIFVISMSGLIIAEYFDLGMSWFNPKLYIGIVIASAFFTDRMYVKYNATKNNNGQNT